MSTRETVHHLAVTCSMHSEPMPQCPLTEIRRLPLQDRARVIEKMSRDQIEYILWQHMLCACGQKGCENHLPRNGSEL